VAKERPECFGHRENELTMRQREEDLIRQMLGKEDCPFATAGRTEIEPLARERPKVVVTAFGIGAAYPRDALEIVATGAKPLPDLLDAHEFELMQERLEVLEDIYRAEEQLAAGEGVLNAEAKARVLNEPAR